MEEDEKGTQRKERAQQKIDEHLEKKAREDAEKDEAHAPKRKMETTVILGPMSPTDLGP